MPGGILAGNQNLTSIHKFRCKCSYIPDLEGFQLSVCYNLAMQLPDRVPGLKWLTILVSIYAVIWISLEGDLRQVLLLSAGLVLLLAGTLIGRFLAGRTYRLLPWLIICAGGGAILGLFFGISTLVSMAIKTGLHGHGPEFTLDEISWVISQIPFWSVLGLLIGAGLGALAAGFSSQSQVD